jgi:hypothetical protein
VKATLTFPERRPREIIYEIIISIVKENKNIRPILKIRKK